MDDHKRNRHSSRDLGQNDGRRHIARSSGPGTRVRVCEYFHTNRMNTTWKTVRSSPPFRMPVVPRMDNNEGIDHVARQNEENSQ
jgi:hypothetical protein